MSDFSVSLHDTGWRDRVMARLDEIIRYPQNHDMEKVELARFARDLLLRNIDLEANFRRIVELEVRRKSNEAPTLIVVQHGGDEL